MGWNNRVFNVNGKGVEMLAATLALAFRQEGGQEKPVAAWKVDPKHGLVLLWHAEEGSTKFLSELSAAEVAPAIQSWLESEEAKAIELQGWDGDCDHDGDNSKGWRVFCEDWGHVGGCHYALCAVRPAYLWHGK